MTSVASSTDFRYATICGRRVVLVPDSAVNTDGRNTVVVVDHSGSMKNTGRRVEQAVLCMKTVKSATPAVAPFHISSFGDSVESVDSSALDAWEPLGGGTKLTALAEAMLSAVTTPGHGDNQAPAPPAVAPKSTFVFITDSELVNDHMAAATMISQTAFPGSRFLFLGVGDVHEMSDLVCLVKPEYGLQSFYLHVPEKSQFRAARTMFGSAVATAVQGAGTGAGTGAGADGLAAELGVPVNEIKAILNSSEIVIDGVTSIYVKAGQTYVVPAGASTVHVNGEDVTGLFTDTLDLTPELVERLGDDIVATWMRLYYAALAPKKHSGFKLVAKDDADAILSAVRKLAREDVDFVDKLLRLLGSRPKFSVEEAMMRVGGGHRLTAADRAAIRANVYVVEQSRQDLLGLCRTIKGVIDGEPSETSMEMARGVWEGTSRGTTVMSQKNVDRLLGRVADKQDSELLTKTLAALEDPDYKPALNQVADALDAYGLVKYPELAEGCVITGEQGTALVFMGVNVRCRGLAATENPLLVHASGVDTSPVSLAAALSSLRATGKTRMTVDDINGIVGVLPGAAWRAAQGHTVFVSHLTTGDVNTRVQGLRAALAPLVGVETALSQRLKEHAEMMALGWAALAARLTVRPLDAHGLVVKDSPATCALDAAFDLLEVALGDPQYFGSRAFMRPSMWAALAFALNVVKTTPVPEVAKYATRTVTSDTMDVQLLCAELAHQATFARSRDATNAPAAAKPWLYAGKPTAETPSVPSVGGETSAGPEDDDDEAEASSVLPLVQRALQALSPHGYSLASTGINYAVPNTAEDAFFAALMRRCRVLLVVLGMPPRETATLSDRAVVWDTLERGHWSAALVALHSDPSTWVSDTSMKMAAHVSKLEEAGRDKVFTACTLAFNNLQNTHLPVMLAQTSGPDTTIMTGMDAAACVDCISKVPFNGEFPDVTTGLLRKLSCQLDADSFLAVPYANALNSTTGAFGPDGKDGLLPRLHATLMGVYRGFPRPVSEDDFVQRVVSMNRWPDADPAYLTGSIRDFWFNMQVIEGSITAVAADQGLEPRPEPFCADDEPYWHADKWSFKKAVLETVAFFAAATTAAGRNIDARPLLAELWKHRRNLVSYTQYRTKALEYAAFLHVTGFVTEDMLRYHFHALMQAETRVKAEHAGIVLADQ